MYVCNLHNVNICIFAFFFQLSRLRQNYNNLATLNVQLILLNVLFKYLISISMFCYDYMNVSLLIELRMMLHVFTHTH